MVVEALDSCMWRTNSAVMHVLAPAKINLHLRVGPARADGFHPLMSWMCTVGLFDTLEFDYAEDAVDVESPTHVRLVCDDPNLPTDERNLVVRVTSSWGRRVYELEKKRVRPLRARLEKKIPAGAGLGGGSSDGASALRAVNQLWETGASDLKLAEFAELFGSDLPFFFYGPSSVCTGRGETVQPVARPRPKWAMLVLPDIMMPTPEVYRRFDQMELGRDELVKQMPDWSAWARLSAADLLPMLANDLEAPAFSISKRLRELRETVERSMQRIVRMSGSGSSLFTIFDDRDEAQAAAKKINEDLAVRALAVELAPDAQVDSSNALSTGM